MAPKTVPTGTATSMGMTTAMSAPATIVTDCPGAFIGSKKLIVCPASMLRGPVELIGPFKVMPPAPVGAGAKSLPLLIALLTNVRVVPLVNWGVALAMVTAPPVAGTGTPPTGFGTGALLIGPILTLSLALLPAITITLPSAPPLVPRVAILQLGQ